jgi:hypothetical protein
MFLPVYILHKQDIMRVHCMQNVTKYYISLRNVASDLLTHVVSQTIVNSYSMIYLGVAELIKYSFFHIRTDF